MARRALEAHGVAQLAARTFSQRQRSLLMRVGRHLADDSRLSVTGGPHPDGYSYVTVYPADGPRPGFFGEPRGMPDS